MKTHFISRDGSSIVSISCTSPTQVGNANPAPFFQTRVSGFLESRVCRNPGFGSATMKPGFETRVSGLRYRELKLSNIMNEQLNF